MFESLNRSIGRVWPIPTDSAFHLESRSSIAPLVIAYETYGRLDATRGNAILVCHALTGSAHAAGADVRGKKGWWDGLIGPGKALDTDRYFIICSNVIGSCYGSTGPNEIDPATDAIHGSDFPTVTIRDIVRAQRLFLWKLGVERLHAVIGGSMGGMQVLEWSLLFPNDVSLAIPIATGAIHSPWRTALTSAAREAITLGRAAGDETAGLRLARKIATVSYRSSIEFSERFAYSPRVELPDSTETCFPVQSYLEHQAYALAGRFDAATYETLTRAMDLHDIRRGRGELEETLGLIPHPTLCIGISTDLLYPCSEVRELARLIPSGRYAEIESIHGHDAFLIEYNQLNRIVAGFLAEHAPALHPIPPATQPEEYNS